jgi:hypothetical protein
MVLQTMVLVCLCFGKERSYRIKTTHPSHRVNNNHHVAGKDMCVGFLCIHV